MRTGWTQIRSHVNMLHGTAEQLQTPIIKEFPRTSLYIYLLFENFGNIHHTFITCITILVNQLRTLGHIHIEIRGTMEYFSLGLSCSVMKLVNVIFSTATPLCMFSKLSNSDYVYAWCNSLLDLFFLDFRLFNFGFEITHRSTSCRQHVNLKHIRAVAYYHSLMSYFLCSLTIHKPAAM